MQKKLYTVHKKFGVGDCLQFSLCENESVTYGGEIWHQIAQNLSNKPRYLIFVTFVCAPADIAERLLDDYLDINNRVYECKCKEVCHNMSHIDLNASGYNYLRNKANLDLYNAKLDWMNDEKQFIEWLSTFGIHNIQWLISGMKSTDFFSFK